MKAINILVKLVIALAAVAGVVYVAATYGERIVAWAKRTLARFQGTSGCPDTEEAPAAEEIPEEAPAAEEIPEEAPAAEEAPVEEAPAEEAEAPAAAEEDFEA